MTVALVHFVVECSVGVVDTESLHISILWAYTFGDNASCYSYIV